MNRARVVGLPKLSVGPVDLTEEEIREEEESQIHHGNPLGLPSSHQQDRASMHVQRKARMEQKDRVGRALTSTGGSSTESERRLKNLFGDMKKQTETLNQVAKSVELLPSSSDQPKFSGYYSPQPTKRKSTTASPSGSSMPAKTSTSLALERARLQKLKEEREQEEERFSNEKSEQGDLLRRMTKRRPIEGIHGAGVDPSPSFQSNLQEITDSLSRGLDDEETSWLNGNASLLAGDDGKNVTVEDAEDFYRKQSMRGKNKVLGDDDLEKEDPAHQKQQEDLASPNTDGLLRPDEFASQNRRRSSSQNPSGGGGAFGSPLGASRHMNLNLDEAEDTEILQVTVGFIRQREARIKHEFELTKLPEVLAAKEEGKEIGYEEGKADGVAAAKDTVDTLQAHVGNLKDKVKRKHNEMMLKHLEAFKQGEKINTIRDTKMLLEELLRQFGDVDVEQLIRDNAFYLEEREYLYKKAFKSTFGYTEPLDERGQPSGAQYLAKKKRNQRGSIIDDLVHGGSHVDHGDGGGAKTTLDQVKAASGKVTRSEIYQQLSRAQKQVFLLTKELSATKDALLETHRSLNSTEEEKMFQHDAFLNPSPENKDQIGGKAKSGKRSLIDRLKKQHGATVAEGDDQPNEGNSSFAGSFGGSSPKSHHQDQNNLRLLVTTPEVEPDKKGSVLVGKLQEMTHFLSKEASRTEEKRNTLLQIMKSTQPDLQGFAYDKPPLGSGGNGPLPLSPTLMKTETTGGGSVSNSKKSASSPSKHSTTASSPNTKKGGGKSGGTGKKKGVSGGSGGASSPPTAATTDCSTPLAGFSSENAKSDILKRILDTESRWGSMLQAIGDLLQAPSSPPSIDSVAKKTDTSGEGRVESKEEKEGSAGSDNGASGVSTLTALLQSHDQEMKDLIDAVARGTVAAAPSSPAGVVPSPAPTGLPKPQSANQQRRPPSSLGTGLSIENAESASVTAPLRRTGSAGGTNTTAPSTPTNLMSVNLRDGVLGGGGSSSAGGDSPSGSRPVSRGRPPSAISDFRIPSAEGRSRNKFTAGVKLNTTASKSGDCVDAETNTDPDHPYGLSPGLDVWVRQNPSAKCPMCCNFLDSNVWQTDSEGEIDPNGSTEVLVQKENNEEEEEQSSSQKSDVEGDRQETTPSKRGKMLPPEPHNRKRWLRGAKKRRDVEAELAELRKELSAKHSKELDSFQEAKDFELKGKDYIISEKSKTIDDLQTQIRENKEVKRLKIRVEKLSNTLQRVVGGVSDTNDKILSLHHDIYRFCHKFRIILDLPDFMAKRMIGAKKKDKEKKKGFYQKMVAQVAAGDQEAVQYGEQAALKLEHSDNLLTGDSLSVTAHLKMLVHCQEKKQNKTKDLAEAVRSVAAAETAESRGARGSNSMIGGGGSGFGEGSSLRTPGFAPLTPGGDKSTSSSAAAAKSSAVTTGGTPGGKTNKKGGAKKKSSTTTSSSSIAHPAHIFSNPLEETNRDADSPPLPLPPPAPPTALESLASFVAHETTLGSDLLNESSSPVFSRKPLPSDSEGAAVVAGSDAAAPSSPTGGGGSSSLFYSLDGPKGRIGMVFADVEGSSQLWEKHPEEMKDCLDVYTNALKEALTMYSGYIAKSTGDAHMFTFASVSDAVAFSVTIHETMMNFGWKSVISSAAANISSSSSSASPAAIDRSLWNGLRMRIGCHVGEPVAELDVLTQRTDYFGGDVISTAELASFAYGGQTLISSQALIESGLISLHDLLSAKEWENEEKQQNGSVSTARFSQLVPSQIISNPEEEIEIPGPGSAKTAGDKRQNWNYVNWDFRTLRGQPSSNSLDKTHILSVQTARLADREIDFRDRYMQIQEEEKKKKQQQAVMSSSSQQSQQKITPTGKKTSTMMKRKGTKGAVKEDDVPPALESIVSKSSTTTDSLPVDTTASTAPDSILMKIPDLMVIAPPDEITGKSQSFAPKEQLNRKTSSTLGGDGSSRNINRNSSSGGGGDFFKDDVDNDGFANGSDFMTGGGDEPVTMVVLLVTKPATLPTKSWRHATSILYRTIRSLVSEARGYPARDNKTDLFHYVFRNTMYAVRFAVQLQRMVLNLEWDTDTIVSTETFDPKTNKLSFRGLCPKIGIHRCKAEATYDNYLQKMRFNQGEAPIAAGLALNARLGEILATDKVLEAMSSQWLECGSPFIQKLPHNVIVARHGPVAASVILPEGLEYRIGQRAEFSVKRIVAKVNIDGSTTSVLEDETDSEAEDNDMVRLVEAKERDEKKKEEEGTQSEEDKLLAKLMELATCEKCQAPFPRECYRCSGIECEGCHSIFHFPNKCETCSGRGSLSMLGGTTSLLTNPKTATGGGDLSGLLKVTPRASLTPGGASSLLEIGAGGAGGGAGSSTSSHPMSNYPNRDSFQLDTPPSSLTPTTKSLMVGGVGGKSASSLSGANKSSSTTGNTATKVMRSPKNKDSPGGSTRNFSPRHSPAPSLSPSTQPLQPPGGGSPSSGDQGLTPTNQQPQNVTPRASSSSTLPNLKLGGSGVGGGNKKHREERQAILNAQMNKNQTRMQMGNLSIGGM